MTTETYIESILFFKGVPVSESFLAKVLGKKEEEIKEALNALEKNLQNRGLVLNRQEGQVSLGTNPEASGFIETLIKDDLERDLGKAGLETLSIVIYRGPVSRSQIDYIRGVNSSFILRNLLVRGLVEKVKNDKDQRVSFYNPTFKLLSYLGLKNMADMPEYKELRNDIENFEKQENDGDER